mmetsp:Transcript_29093/g.96647  ORF Transcript_29093/g.96647 Transcript_29093/m.96647 type:complete len:210 (-) Transcript_29093:1457-2086(-)
MVHGQRQAQRGRPRCHGVVGRRGVRAEGDRVARRRRRGRSRCGRASEALGARAHVAVLQRPWLLQCPRRGRQKALHGLRQAPVAAELALLSALDQAVHGLLQPVVPVLDLLPLLLHVSDPLLHDAKQRRGQAGFLLLHGEVQVWQHIVADLLCDLRILGDDIHSTGRELSGLPEGVLDRLGELRVRMPESKGGKLQRASDGNLQLQQLI